MTKNYQIAFIGAVAAALAACSTTPTGSDGSQAQARTERVCFEQESSSGSRLSRRVCRNVEKETAEKAESATES